MSEYVAIALSGLLPLILVIAMLVLLTRIADSIDRLEATLDRRLLSIQQAVRQGVDEADSRWLSEAE